METYGQIDFAFNNAGVEGLSNPTALCTEENWDKVIGINLTGVFLCMKYILPVMLEQGKGAIVNNASVAGLVGFQNSPAYVASKHGIVGLTKTTALEYIQKGIRVNAVCPGIISTPMIDRFTGKNKEIEKQFVSMEPIGRMGEPAEVANAVVWLCSNEASFISGHAMPIDGAWTAQ
jgi:NAD(P)-dependent dehydrogenase (short-subunit alcohol dehydrogenase family)